jgi:hypothetical protein
MPNHIHAQANIEDILRAQAVRTTVALIKKRARVYAKSPMLLETVYPGLSAATPETVIAVARHYVGERFASPLVRGWGKPARPYAVWRDLVRAPDDRNRHVAAGSLNLQPSVVRNLPVAVASAKESHYAETLCKRTQYVDELCFVFCATLWPNRGTHHLYQFSESMTRKGDSERGANLIQHGERGDSPCQLRSDLISMRCSYARSPARQRMGRKRGACWLWLRSTAGRRARRLRKLAG